LKLQPGAAISVGVYWNVPSHDPDSVQTGYLVTNGQLFKAGLHEICVSPSQQENLRTAFLYDAQGTGEENPDFALVQKNPNQTKIMRTIYVLGWVAILLSVFDFWLIPPARKIIVLGSLVLILVGIVVNIHSATIYTVTWERRQLPAAQMTHIQGYSYKIDLGIDWMDRRSPGGSPAIVYENGISLKHPNNSLFSIKQRGKGRFSVQDGYLFFSTSDNSNPQSNDRTYEIYWPTPIPILDRAIFYISSLVGLFFLARYFPVSRRTT
jgi:hypothetical protein